MEVGDIQSKLPPKEKKMSRTANKRRTGCALDAAAGPRTRARVPVVAWYLSCAYVVCVRALVRRPLPGGQIRFPGVPRSSSPSPGTTTNSRCLRYDGRAGGQPPGQRGVHIGGRVAKDAGLFRGLGLVGRLQERGGHGRWPAVVGPLRHRHRRRRRSGKGRAERKRWTGRRAAAAAGRRQPGISSAAVSVVVRVRRPFLRQNQGKPVLFKR